MKVSCDLWVWHMYHFISYRIELFSWYSERICTKNSTFKIWKKVLIRLVDQMFVYIARGLTCSCVSKCTTEQKVKGEVDSGKQNTHCVLWFSRRAHCCCWGGRHTGNGVLEVANPVTKSLYVLFSQAFLCFTLPGTKIKNSHTISKLGYNSVYNTLHKAGKVVINSVITSMWRNTLTI